PAPRPRHEPLAAERRLSGCRGKEETRHVNAHAPIDPQTDPVVPNVLERYPLPVSDVRLLSDKGKKAVWEIRSKAGVYVLKKTPLPAERQRFLNTAVHHLRRGGATLPAIIPTATGDDFVPVERSCYVLYEAVEGRAPNYEDADDLREILRSLAAFHRASRGYSPPPDARERSHLGRWERSYELRLAKLRFYAERAVYEDHPVALAVRETSATFLREAETALALLHQPAYRQWVEKVGEERNLCHQDYAAGNLIVTEAGIAAIDTDSLTVDLPARDLRKILNKVMKKLGWDEARTHAMLAAYHSVHPLTADEYAVVAADLRFPHLYYGIVTKAFEDRAADWTPDKLLAKLHETIDTETAKMRVLDRWNDIVAAVLTGT
ncbi:CotS family spore coat protein, partial [Calditerricola satsumensis]